MTKMIYIPPFAMLNQMTGYRQLMLPHLIWNEEYCKHFRKTRNLGQYIILDNGAAEGQEVAWSRLIDVANEYRVDELVLPDTLGNPIDTLSKGKDFIKDLGGQIPARTKLGFVLHGNNARDAIETYERLKRDSAAFFKRLEVLYIPRILVTPENPKARIEVADYILRSETLPRRIHFLGASPHRIDEGKWLREGLVRAVRSMDTSAPFVYALRHSYVNDGKKYLRDQDTYFSSLVTNNIRAIAMRNCEVMDEWIGAKASASQV